MIITMRKDINLIHFNKTRI